MSLYYKIYLIACLSFLACARGAPSDSRFALVQANHSLSLSQGGSFVIEKLPLLRMKESEWVACLSVLSNMSRARPGCWGIKKGRIIFQLSGLLKKLFDHEHISLTFAVVASHLTDIVFGFANEDSVTFALTLRAYIKVHYL